MSYVYFLKSRRFDKIYIGFTSNLNNRIEAHNHLKNKGWTKSFMPWELIYYEEYTSKSKGDALKREKQLKTAQGRKFIYENILDDGKI